MASNMACGGAPRPSSILTNPMKRGMLISPSGWWELLSRTYVEPRRVASTSTSEVLQTDREAPLIGIAVPSSPDAPADLLAVDRGRCGLLLFRNVKPHLRRNSHHRHASALSRRTANLG